MSEETTIYAVFSHPENGREAERKWTNKMLKVGVKYNVKSIKVFPYFTSVCLDGVDGLFNSVFFDFEKNGEAYDPTKDTKNWSFWR